MKLYQVTTIVKEFDDCKDVSFHWFRHDRGERRAYGELIENYDPSDDHAAYGEGAIDELFTEIEATALKEYLDREHADSGVTTIEEVHLPISNNVASLHGRPKNCMPIGKPGSTNPIGTTSAGKPVIDENIF